ncbi:RadC family protein [Rhodovastum atsumiense]|uniref:RadC family protein n=1 Tax=Rhodovastum atsumiense TaxID=504468 RepID=UPI00139F29EA|nr:DNA repair protein RadC [Rhodovastum atsumiense]
MPSDVIASAVVVRGEHYSGFAEQGPGLVQEFNDAQANLARLYDETVERELGDMSDQEYLEMLVLPGTNKRNSRKISKALITKFGNITNVLSATASELLSVQGVNVSIVRILATTKSAAVKMAKSEIINLPIVNNIGKLIGYLNSRISRSSTEQFLVLFLDGKNHLLADETLGSGTVNHTPVYPREVVKRALELHATALILVHNHPSGDPSPSLDDIHMTQKIKQAASALDIFIHDHIIIGKGRWLSFRSANLL